jgi:hypothetical protein
MYDTQNLSPGLSLDEPFICHRLNERSLFMDCFYPKIKNDGQSIRCKDGLYGINILQIVRYNNQICFLSNVEISLEVESFLHYPTQEKLTIEDRALLVSHFSCLTNLRK